VLNVQLEGRGEGAHNCQQNCRQVDSPSVIQVCHHHAYSYSSTSSFSRRLTSAWWWTAVRRKSCWAALLSRTATARRPERWRAVASRLSSWLCKRREWPEVVATYRRHHVEGCIATALPQATETIRRRAWWLAVLLRHGDSVSTGVRLSCVARSLTTAQTKALESLQRRATRIIFQDND